MLREAAMREAEEVLATSGATAAVSGSRDEIELEVQPGLKSMTSIEVEVEQRLKC